MAVVQPSGPDGKISRRRAGDSAPLPGANPPGRLSCGVSPKRATAGRRSHDLVLLGLPPDKCGRYERRATVPPSGQSCRERAGQEWTSQNTQSSIEDSGEAHLGQEPGFLPPGTSSSLLLLSPPLIHSANKLAQADRRYCAQGLTSPRWCVRSVSAAARATGPVSST